MIIINTQEELEALIDKNNIIIKDDLIIRCNININAHITARNIRAKNIRAWNIDAWDIKAWNINARNIKAWNIIYYSVCFAHANITCKSIAGTRKNAKHFCLDGQITIEA